MPRYQKRHYIEIAELLHSVKKDHSPLTPEQAVILGTMYARFLHVFATDNPRFDVARFQTAVFEGK